MGHLVSHNVRTGYGRIEVVSGVGLEAKEGQIACILGPNGSGKSTMLKTLAGAQPTWAGDIWLDGQSIKAQKTEERIRSGIATMPQGGSVFGELSIEANLKLGGFSLKRSDQVRQRVEAVYEIFPVLAQKRRARGDDLSGGQRMLLSFGQMMMTDPEVFLLDEPSAGLSPAIVKELFGILEDLKHKGKTILIVEQNVKDVLEIADHVYVLVQGQLAFNEARGKVSDLREIMDIYMQVASA